MAVVGIVGSAAIAGAQPTNPPPDQQPQQEQQPPPHQTAQEAMQGGVTEEQALADEQARAHFRVGQSMYDAGRFGEAAHEFEEAYRLSRRAELLFNAYVAFRDANDLEGAVRSLRGYIRDAENVPDRLNLEARLRSMQQALDDRARQVVVVQADPEPEAPPPRSAEAWPWIMLGTGAAAAIVSIFTGLVVNDQVAQLSSMCPSTSNFVCPPGTDISGLQGSARTLAITTDILLFGGGAIAVTGFIFALLFGFDEGRAAPAQAAAFCDSEGCRGLLRGSF